MDASSLIQQSSHGTMVEREEDEESLGSLSCSSNGDCDSCTDEITSSSSSSYSSSSLDKEPIFEMSSLGAHLPIKRRGLSRHYQGKSQSFTCLSDVCCLEDLVKPERLPWRKRLKTSKSCGGGLDSQKLLSPKGCFGAVSKKGSRSSLASLGGRRRGFLGSKPPVPPRARMLA